MLGGLRPSPLDSGKAGFLPEQDFLMGISILRREVDKGTGTMSTKL